MMPEEDESAGEPEHELAPTAIVVEAQGAKASIALEMTVLMSIRLM